MHMHLITCVQAGGPRHGAPDHASVKPRARPLRWEIKAEHPAHRACSVCAHIYACELSTTGRFACMGPN